MRLVADNKPALADGEILLSDGGTHGRAGHQLWVEADGRAYWRRATDSLMPSGRVGRGPCPLTEHDLSRIRAFADTAWAIAERQRQERIAHRERMRAHWESPAVENAPPGSPPMLPPEIGDMVPPQAPRWVWSIAQQRDGVLRVAKGSDTAPDEPELRAALRWLAQTVDHLAAVAPIEQTMLLAIVPPLGRQGLFDGCVSLLEIEFVNHTSTQLRLLEPEGPLFFQCTALEEIWNTGHAPSAAQDLEALRRAADAAWEHGQSVAVVEEPPINPPMIQPPQRAWGVFVRRGPEIRVAHGEGDVADAVRPHFAWMKRRVPELVAAHEHVWNASFEDDD